MKTILISIIVIISSLASISQVPDKKINQKDYFEKIFNNKDRDGLSKTSHFYSKGDAKLAESNKFKEEADQLNQIADAAANPKTKNKAINKSSSAFDKSLKYNKDALKLYHKGNKARYKIYSNNFHRVRLKDSSELAIRGHELEKEADQLFLTASKKRKKSSELSGKPEVEMITDACNMELEALLDQEKAFGIYMNDPDCIYEVLMKNKNSINKNSSKHSNVFDSIANNKDFLVSTTHSNLTANLVENDSTQSFSTILASNADNTQNPEINLNGTDNKEPNTNKTSNQEILISNPLTNNTSPQNLNIDQSKENQIFTKFGITKEEQDQLIQNNENCQSANKLMREVDKLNVSVEELNDKVVNASNPSDLDNYLTQSKELNSKAFEKLVEAINMRLGVNETKLNIYRKYAEKYRLNGSTLEARRGQQLEDEAEKYVQQAQKKIVVANKQDFQSEQYTMLMEANELMSKALQKQEKAYGIYLNLTPLSDEDVRQLNEMENKLALNVSKDTNDLLITDDQPNAIKNYTPEKNFSFTVKKIFTYSKDKPDTIDFKHEKGLVFMIQAGIYDKLPSEASKLLSPVMGEKFANNPFTRFYLGNFKTIEAAELVLETVQDELFEDAYIVGFVDGKRTELPQAKALINSEKFMKIDEYKKLSDKEIFEFKNPGKKLNEEEKIIISNKSEKVYISDGQENTLIEAKEIDNIKGFMYTIQIGIFNQTPTKGELQNLEPVLKIKSDKGLKYTYGNFNTYAEAKAEKKRIDSLGFKNTFIIPFNNGKKIEIEQALKIETTKETIFADANTKEIIYSVQVGSYKTPLSSIDFSKKYIDILKYHRIDDYFDNETNSTIYTIGKFQKYEEASKLVDEIKQLGEDGFVVALKGNSKVASDKKNIDKKTSDNKTDQKNTDKTSDKVVYKVQIGAFKNELSKADLKTKFTKVPVKYKIEHIKDEANELIIYTIGNFKTHDQASGLQKKLKTEGFNGFVVAFEGNKKVSSKTASEESKKTIETSVKPDKKEKTNKPVKKEKTIVKDDEQVEKDTVTKMEPVVYKIQLGTTDKALNNNELKTKFKVPGNSKVEAYFDKEINKTIYLTGNFKDYNKAVKAKEDLGNSGTFGFIVAFQGDKKITLYKAKKLEQLLK